MRSSRRDWYPEAVPLQFARWGDPPAKPRWTLSAPSARSAPSASRFDRRDRPKPP